MNGLSRNAVCFSSFSLWSTERLQCESFGGLSVRALKVMSSRWAGIPPLYGEGGERSEPGGVLAAATNLTLPAQMTPWRGALYRAGPHPAAHSPSKDGRLSTPYGGHPPRKGEGFARRPDAASLQRFVD